MTVRWWPGRDVTGAMSAEGHALRARFEELAWRETTMGEISLRRRFDPVAKVDVYEVRLATTS